MIELGMMKTIDKNVILQSRQADRSVLNCEAKYQDNISVPVEGQKGKNIMKIINTVNTEELIKCKSAEGFQLIYYKDLLSLSFFSKFKEYIIFEYTPHHNNEALSGDIVAFNQNHTVDILGFHQLKDINYRGYFLIFTLNEINLPGFIIGSVVSQEQLRRRIAENREIILCSQ